MLHFIIDKINLFLKLIGNTYFLGIKCKTPRDETHVSLFLNVSNAVLCGNNINKPYKLLNK